MFIPQKRFSNLPPLHEMKACQQFQRYLLQQMETNGESMSEKDLDELNIQLKVEFADNVPISNIIEEWSQVCDQCPLCNE